MAFRIIMARDYAVLGRSASRWCSSAALGVFGLTMILACGGPSSSPSVDPSALDGFRFTQARWVGLEHASCTLSEGELFPVAQCDGDDVETTRRRDDALLALASSLPSKLGASATATQLRLRARGEALVGTQDAVDLRRAEATLLDALGRAEGRDAAEVASDLAAARLTLAERLQSAVIVVDALDAASRALEAAPDHPEALFNQDLALLWLGVWGEMPGPAEDPWRTEQRVVLSGVQDLTKSDDICWTRAELRTEISTWSTGEPASSIPPWWDVQHACWRDSGDRLFADVLDDLEADPSGFAQQWRQVDAAKAALRAFDLDAAVLHMRELRGAASHPLRLAGLGFEVQEAFFRSDNEAVDSLVTMQLEESRSRSYLEMVARNLLQQALTQQTAGDLGGAADLFNEALVFADRAEAMTLLPAIRAFRVEVWEKIGREEDAWFEVVHALRSLDDVYDSRRLAVLQSAARLADRRGAQHARWILLNIAVSEARLLGPVQEAGLLKDRGEASADRGDLIGARQDLKRGQSILQEAMAQGAVDASIAQHVLDDLGLLEGRVAATPEARVASLERTVAAYRQDDYGHRLVRAQGRLASARLAVGNAVVAKEDLRVAFHELTQQARSYASAPDAVALLAAGRNVAGDLMALQLENGEDADALGTLGTYLSLRQEESSPVEPPAEGTQRLAFFVRNDEVLAFLENGEELRVHRLPVTRRLLLKLRTVLLAQLSTGAKSDSVDHIAAELSDRLLAPILANLREDLRLHIVADDVLAGLPFHVLPLGNDGNERLLDAFAVSYGTDLKRPRPFRLPESLLVVGVGEAPPDLEPLPRAEREARAVEAMYGENRDADLWVTQPALPKAILASIPKRDGLHVASHFRVNAQRPGASALLLGADTERQHLALEDLLRALPSEGLELLYLSGCDTGAGLAPSPHGVHSLAQLMTHPAIGTAVLSLWKLDDRIAGPLAESFYRHLLAGEEPSAALRLTYLEHRHRESMDWGAVAAYR